MNNPILPSFDKIEIKLELDSMISDLLEKITRSIAILLIPHWSLA